MTWLTAATVVVPLIAFFGDRIDRVEAGGISTVTCNDTSLNWSFNAEGQDPCQVAANLSAVCSTDGTFTVSPLTPVFDNGYLPPDLTSKCTCSTVTYAVISACSLCQGGIVTGWQFWYTNCTQGTNGSFPFTIPKDTNVPKWAFLDVLSKNTFDPSEAQAIGDKPEVTAGSPPFALPTLAANSSSSSSNSGSSPTNSGGSGGGGKKSNAGAIAGGVVGGVVALVAIAGLVFFLLRRKRAKREAAVQQSTAAYPASYNDNMTQRDPNHGQSYVATPYQHDPPMSPTSGYDSTRPYDPNDPSTFPSHEPPKSGSLGGTTYNGYNANDSSPTPNTGYPNYNNAYPQAQNQLPQHIQRHSAYSGGGGGTGSVGSGGAAPGGGGGYAAGYTGGYSGKAEI